MLTRLLSPGPDTYTEAGHIFRNGGLVAFPTETVYGLGGNALLPAASQHIYSAKGRPSDNPLIVHIADTSDVYKLADNVTETARTLMEAFWPGPLTIILPKKELVPDTTTGGLSTVAIRMPSHPAALELIRRSGLYIAAPSANTSGRPSPTTAEHVMEDLNGKIEAVIDGGAVGIGIESTIVDLSDETPTILRPGYITKKMLEELIGEVKIDPTLIRPDPNMRPKAPGMKYTHYAPSGELYIVEGESAVSDTINSLYNEKKSEGKTVKILAPKEHADQYDSTDTITVGSISDGVTVAARLYSALRECDKMNADYIYSESFMDYELGGAIMNRLLKAAGHKVINV